MSTTSAEVELGNKQIFRRALADAKNRNPGMEKQLKKVHRSFRKSWIDVHGKKGLAKAGKSGFRAALVSTLSRPEISPRDYPLVFQFALSVGGVMGFPRFRAEAVKLRDSKRYSGKASKGKNRELSQP